MNATTQDSLNKALSEALNHMFYSILKVDPKNDRVLILRDKGQSELNNKELSWSLHMITYGELLTSKSREDLYNNLSSSALYERYNKGDLSFTLDLAYIKDGVTNWLEAFVSISKEDDLIAYVFIKQNNKEHLLHSIIETYVFNTSDYFIYLDLKNNSYLMFSSSKSGVPLPPKKGDDYEREVVRYIEEYAVEEDRELVLNNMSISNILKKLEKRNSYSFTYGLYDPERGYTRKQLSYHYYDKKAQKVLLNRTDVTELYLENLAREKELDAARRQAETDPLTELYNYAGIKVRVEKSLMDKDKLSALLFIDIDNFKDVNDKYSHHEGDRLLWKVAQVLKLHTSSKDVVGRVGGDEFIVYLDDIKSKNEAYDCANHICNAINNLSILNANDIPLSCSIGGAFSDIDGSTYLKLASVADRRSYIVKEKGKNSYLFEDD